MERQYVGIDLHRRTSTIHRMSGDGEVLGCARVPSQPMELTQAIAEAGPEPEVVLESTYGWYWAADLLQELGDGLGQHDVRAEVRHMPGGRTPARRGSVDRDDDLRGAHSSTRSLPESDLGPGRPPGPLPTRRPSPSWRKQGSFESSCREASPPPPRGVREVLRPGSAVGLIEFDRAVGVVNEGDPGDTRESGLRLSHKGPIRHEHE